MRALAAAEYQQGPVRAPGGPGRDFGKAGRDGLSRLQKRPSDGGPDHPNLRGSEVSARRFEGHEYDVCEWPQYPVGHTRIRIRLQDHPADAQQGCGHQHGRTAIASDPDHEIRLPRSEDPERLVQADRKDRKSTRLNSSHRTISYAVFCLKK